MQITRPDEQTVCLSRLDSLLTELLRRIPQSADPGDNSAARARLFSSPSHDLAESELAEDWRDFVEPELQSLFLSTRELVENDLKVLHVDKSDGEGSLTLPAKHLESWIHALNQARLALAARYDFTEAEMEENLPWGGNPRAVALLQIRFYGFLQELFLRELDDD